ncbi:DeoR/GlpR family DNA-binding transcription regulator [Gorillibacterium sp. sgz5001074]|uniref:DeoR/GlpR family DNA-binding transcription regulator n=1 Tax=Gorillibacterium sp. sgz5001074 TaxID=3446695 RepID=UPI003F68214D
MFQEERLDRIIRHLQDNRRITVEELCALLDISKDTARRDLIKLEEQRRIVRTRGGAMLPSFSKEIDHYEKRLHTERGVKREIAHAAARLVRPGDYLMLDSSTTVQFTVESISFSGNVAVTNSIDIAGLLASREGVTLHLLGGQLHKEQRYVYGPRAAATLAEYRFDKLLLGACGITAEGLSNPYEEEGLLIRDMIRSADQVIVLADSSKFGKRLFCRVAGFDSVDVLVTNEKPPAEIMEQLEKYGVDVIVTGTDAGHGGV